MRGFLVTWQFWRTPLATSPITWLYNRLPTRQCWQMPSTHCLVTCITNAGFGQSNKERLTLACRLLAEFYQHLPSKICGFSLLMFISPCQTDFLCVYLFICRTSVFCGNKIFSGELLWYHPHPPQHHHPWTAAYNFLDSPFLRNF